MSDLVSVVNRSGHSFKIPEGNGLSGSDTLTKLLLVYSNFIAKFVRLSL